jgi:hypothetical protein
MEYQILMLVSEEYQTDTPDTRLILAEQFADVHPTDYWQF